MEQMVKLARPSARLKWRRSCSTVLAASLAAIAIAGTVRTDQLVADRDRDGIADCRERAGLRIEGGGVVKTKPSVSDSDGDGIADGDEVKPVATRNGFRQQIQDLRSCRSATYSALSDPSLSDTDGDGLIDSIELSEGTDPYVGDLDEDGLSDAEELEWGSDPLASDTDGDKLIDGEDVRGRLTPVTVDDATEDKNWASEFGEGALLGNLREPDTVPQLLGMVGAGLLSSIPVVGTVPGFFADLRDTLTDLFRGDFSGAAASAVGALPILGDGSKLALTIRDFVAKNPKRLGAVLKGIGDLPNLPDSVRIRLIKFAAGNDVTGLREVGLTEKQVLEFAKRKADLRQLRRDLAGSVRPVSGIRTSTDRAGFATGLQGAQAALREHARVTDGTDDVTDGAVYISDVSVEGFAGGRLIDACTKCAHGLIPGTSTLRIAKLGSLYDSNSLGSQIAKDVLLLDRGYDLEWHFFTGPTGWTVDPTVMDALDDASIPYFIHLPD